MPCLDLPQSPFQLPCEAIPKPSDPLNPYDIAVDELSLYGQCTNPVYCGETNVKRGDDCPKCGHKRE